MDTANFICSLCQKHTASIVRFDSGKTACVMCVVEVVEGDGGVVALVVEMEEKMLIGGDE